MTRLLTSLAVYILLFGGGIGFSRIALKAFNGFYHYHPPLPAAPSEPEANSLLSDRGKVLMILIDGLRYDAFLSHMPLIAGRPGALYRTQVPPPTLSLPSRATMITGAPPALHGITVNSPPQAIEGDHLIRHLHALGKKSGAVSYRGGWDALTDTLFDAGSWIREDRYAKDPLSLRQGEKERLQSALNLLFQERPDFMIFDALALDEIGHRYGGASPEYQSMAAFLDSLLIPLIEAGESLGMTVAVVSDHGHTDRGGHGGGEPEARTVPLFLTGPHIRPATSGEANLTDLASTLALLLGTPPPFENTGFPLFEALDLKDSLKAAYALLTLRQAVKFETERLSLLGLSLDPPDLLSLEMQIRAGNFTSALHTARELHTTLRERVRQAENRKLWGERLRRLPGVLLVLILALLLLGWGVRSLGLKPALLAFFLTLLYFASYYLVFFLTGKGFSFSTLNSEEQMADYFRGVILLGGSALFWTLAAGGVIIRRKAWETLALSASFIFFAVLAQVLVYILLEGVVPVWRLPDLEWGFKFYLDLLQGLGIGLFALPAALVGYGVHRILYTSPP